MKDETLFGNNKKLQDMTACIEVKDILITPLATAAAVATATNVATASISYCMQYTYFLLQPRLAQSKPEPA